MNFNKISAIRKKIRENKDKIYNLLAESIVDWDLIRRLAAINENFEKALKI